MTQGQYTAKKYLIIKIFHQTILTTHKRTRKININGYQQRLAKKRFQCLNEALCFLTSSVLVKKFVLSDSSVSTARNPLLRQAPKRQTV